MDCCKLKMTGLKWRAVHLDLTGYDSKGSLQLCSPEEFVLSPPSFRDHYGSTPMDVEWVQVQAPTRGNTAFRRAVNVDTDTHHVVAPESCLIVVIVLDGAPIASPAIAA